MTDKQKIETLKKAFEETIWMAIRYAKGSSAYAPGMVKDAIKDFQKVYPDWKPDNDITIQLNEIESIKKNHEDELKSAYQREVEAAWACRPSIIQ